MPNSTEPHLTDEPFLTLKDAAARLEIPSFKLTRAAKRGVFPTYTLYNSRKLVRLSEVVAAINSSWSASS